MKKITSIEIFIILIVLICLGFYFIPKLTLSKEQRQYGAMQTNAAMMTSKILAEFSNNENKKSASSISKLLANDLNKLVKNPIEKKNPAYSIEKECLGCVILTADDKTKTVVLTGFDRENKLVVRTVIQPPSFVTYTKDFDEE